MACTARCMAGENSTVGPVEARILRWTNQSPDARWITYDALGKDLVTRNFGK